MSSSRFEDLIAADVTANRPPFGIAGRLFFDRTLKVWQRDTGSEWETLDLSGGSGEGGGGGSGILSLIAGTSISIDNTDPQNPIISYDGGSGGGEGGGNGILSLVSGTGIYVDTADPQNPVINYVGESGASPLAVLDEETTLTTSASAIKFTGDGVTATESEDIVTVNIPGGTGGGSDGGDGVLDIRLYGDTLDDLYTPEEWEEYGPVNALNFEGSAVNEIYLGPPGVANVNIGGGLSIEEIWSELSPNVDTAISTAITNALEAYNPYPPTVLFGSSNSHGQTTLGTYPNLQITPGTNYNVAASDRLGFVWDVTDPPSPSTTTLTLTVPRRVPENEYALNSTTILTVNHPFIDLVIRPETAGFNSYPLILRFRNGRENSNRSNAVPFLEIMESGAMAIQKPFAVRLRFDEYREEAYWGSEPQSGTILYHFPPITMRFVNVFYFPGGLGSTRAVWDIDLNGAVVVSTLTQNNTVIDTF